MTEPDRFTPQTESPRTRRYRTGSPSVTKAIIDFDLVLIRLKELRPKLPLACIRKLRGSKQCEKSARTWNSLALEIRYSLQTSHELTIWEPTMKQIMQFLHCEEHWKNPRHREAVKSIWESLTPSFKDEFITATIAFIEWFCIPHGERYDAASGIDTTYFSTEHSTTISEAQPFLDEPPGALPLDTNMDEHTPIEVDGKIEAVMIQQVTMKNEHNLDDDIYILKHKKPEGKPPCTRYLKIGYSVLTERRKSKVSSEELETVFTKRVKHARRVETLAQTELSNFRRNYRDGNPDSPPSGSTEWFDVEEKVVEKVVKRWIKFIEQEPYDMNGNLKGFWTSRLKCRMRADEKEKFNDHDERDRRWSEFVSPTWSNRAQYYTYSYWRPIKLRLPWTWKYRWQIVSISLALRLSWTISSAYHIIGYLIILWCLLELAWEGALGAPFQTQVRKKTRKARKIGAQTVNRTFERISSFPTSTSCT